MRLLRETRFGDEAAIIPYGAITILADELGTPKVDSVGEREERPAISISHSPGIATAFRATQRGVQPGIDVERIKRVTEPLLAISLRASNKRKHSRLLTMTPSGLRFGRSRRPL